MAELLRHLQSQDQLFIMPVAAGVVAQEQAQQFLVV